MMDTVYGTKKYFQSLGGGGSDIYRSATCRAAGNEYSSYQNTLGRRSGIGPYTHMNKHPSYSTDLSLGSQYAYSTWGIWRDPRNLSPSTYSSKSRQSVKSFSIILTTAAFIVLLAVISIAGLALYFNTFKTNLGDPIMAFEGRFRISKGDLFTTGMKYNHTSAYKQKHDFYKRFVEKSLSDSDLQAARVDITGFGDGPLINVHFRAFIDMRKLPQNIHSLEDHIREALFHETTSMKSLYKSLRIEPDSAEVKRILDEELVKSATFARESEPPTSQTHFEKRLTNKKTGTVEKTLPKVAATHRSKTKPGDDEPDVDVENAPVIQGSFEGSFEITKTDADITRKKTSPTKSVTTSTKQSSHSTFSMKPNPKKTTVERVTSPKPTESLFVRSTTSTTSSTTTMKSTTPLATISTTTRAITTDAFLSINSLKTEKPVEKILPTTDTTLSIPTSTAAQTFVEKLENPEGSISSTQVATNEQAFDFKNPPKLDVNLFTSAPVLDTEPWRPITPPESSLPQQINPSLLPKVNPMYNMRPQTEVDEIESGLLPRNKIKLSGLSTEDPEKVILYHSFTNTHFMPGTEGIEKLGNSDVKPHPLPVPLIDDVIIPEFRPLSEGSHVVNDFPLGLDPGDKFEHIGGGVIVKKHDENFAQVNYSVDDGIKQEKDVHQDVHHSSPITTPTPYLHKPTQEAILSTMNSSIDDQPPTAIEQMLEEEEKQNNTVTTKLTEAIGEFLYDLLDLPKDENITDGDYQIESRIEPDFDYNPNDTKVNENVSNRNKVRINLKSTTSKPVKYNINSETIPTKHTHDNTTKRVRLPGKPKPLHSNSDSKTTPVTFDDSILFPSHSKWEYVNGSSSALSSTSANAMRKVFNETLQAWVVENIDRPENISFKDLKAQKNNTENIQNISSIFDNLASKLGISSAMPTKVPPFIAFSQNKLKQAQKNHNETRHRIKVTPSVKPITVTRRYSPSVRPNTLSTTSSTTTATPVPQAENINMSPEIIVGEAEVEVVDPTKYEEMLSPQSVSSTTPSRPTLVTLLPVRSNSGIRTFRPEILVGESRKFNYQPKYQEAVVKTGIHVTT